MIFRRLNAYTLLGAIAILGWQSCGTQQTLQKTHSALLYSMDTIAPHAKIETLIAPYRTRLENDLNAVIGETVVAMPKIKDKPETLLGNFVADLVLDQTRLTTQKQIDACLLNIGGLRTSLPQGAVTKRNVFELMPFENELVILQLPGSAMQELFTYLAATGGHPVSNIRLEIEDKKPDDEWIAGAEWDETKSYWIVTSDYLANGGDNMTFFSKATQSISTGYKLRDCIIDYMVRKQKMGEKLNIQLDGRIRIDD